MLRKVKYVFALTLVSSLGSCSKDLGGCECKQDGVVSYKSTHSFSLNEDCTYVVDPGDEDNESNLEEGSKDNSKGSIGVIGGGGNIVDPGDEDNELGSGDVVDPGDEDSEASTGKKKKISKFNIRP